MNTQNLFVRKMRIVKRVNNNFLLETCYLMSSTVKLSAMTTLMGFGSSKRSQTL
jgi:hypothetical protein